MKIPSIYIIITSSLFFISGCGETPVNVDETTYIPKIVVEGYLYPEYKPENIRLTRNFPLNQNIELSEILITDAEMSLFDVEKSEAYQLQYNPFTFSYEYKGDNFIIDYGKSYQISISANIDGKDLQTTSTTTVPQKGFAIVPEESVLEPMKYRERDENGELKLFIIAFQKSTDTDFYVVSVVALDASKSTFIEGNPYGIKKDDLDNEILDRLKYEFKWTQAISDKVTIHNMEIPWLDTWFYGRYRAILYAGDRNFKDYFLTHNRVQDIDGNLYEPKFHFEGDGIGVFGSAIADTVYFEVLK